MTTILKYLQDLDRKGYTVVPAEITIQDVLNLLPDPCCCFEYIGDNPDCPQHPPQIPEAQPFDLCAVEGWPWTPQDERDEVGNRYPDIDPFSY